MSRTWTGPLRVQRVGNTYTIRAAFNAVYDMRTFVSLDYNASGVVPFPISLGNTTYHLAETSEAEFTAAVSDWTPHYATSDDAAPLKYTIGGVWTYTGGHHGANLVAQVVANGHGKAPADVGSTWTDGAAKSWCLIKIVDANTLWFIHATTATYATAVTGATLTHAAGATNTGVITVGSQVRTQLVPAARVRKLCLLDGVTNPGLDGWYACSYVDFIEEYDILSPTAIRAYMIANVGATTAKEWVTDSAAVTPDTRISMRYRFARNGSCTIDYRETAVAAMTVNELSGTQAGRLNTPAGGHVYCYIPGAANFTIGANNYTFSTGQLFDTLADAIDLGTARWASAAAPPTRAIFARVTAAGARDFTWSIGYDESWGAADPATRAANVAAAAIAFPDVSSRKFYPRVGGPGMTQTAGTQIAWRCHRCPDDPSDLPAACIARTLYYVDGEWRLSLDFSAAYSGAIALPAWLDGRDAAVVSGSATVSTPAAAGVNVTVVAAGSCTIRLAGYAPATWVLAGTNRGDGTAGTLPAAKVMASAGGTLKPTDVRSDTTTGRAAGGTMRRGGGGSFMAGFR